MGYIGKFEEKLFAQKLRTEGKSYNEIIKYLKVSKNSVSRWCRSIELKPEQIEKLSNKKILGGWKGSLENAKLQKQKRILQTNQIIRNAIKEIGCLTNKEFLIAGTMLYAAEGTKGDDQIGFANSDPSIIKFMMNWFRKYCNISDEKFRGKIYIHDNLDEYQARLYWSKLTDIPLDRFHKSYIVNNNGDKSYKNIHKYGVFSIRICDRNTLRKINGWIKGIIDNVFPGSSMVDARGCG